MTGLTPMSTLEILRVLLSLLALTLLPGWAILAVSGYWRRWEGLQRWFLAVCLGIAFWPPLYYLSRTIFPFVRIGFIKLIILLLICAVAILWKLRKDWREQFQLGKWWWLVLITLVIVFYFRFDLANQTVFPAWTDSLHHSILTELTATTGKLPFNMLPYDSTVLSEYHLGLYALTAPLQLLAKIPAHTALLWMSQFLNALCGIGIFLLLDRKVSRFAAITGMIAVSLFSFQPATYFFWGRFTQLGAQTLLLTGAAVFWDALDAWKERIDEKRSDLWWAALLSSLLLAGLALIHFRVAGYALPLVILIWLVVLFEKPRVGKQFGNVTIAALLVAGLTLVLVAPALVPAIQGYLQPASPLTISLAEDMPNTYFSGNSYNTFRQLGLPDWLTLAALLGGLVGILRTKTRVLAIVMLFWALSLLVMGNLYRLGIGALAFTNITAVFIMAYLPAGVLVGLLGDGIADLVVKITKDKAEKTSLVLILIALLLGVKEHLLIQNDLLKTENFRMFLRADDVKAMRWIAENTPQDALFGINTYLWLPDAAHGSDAGYWIPYFAGRATTSGTMISNFRDDYNLVLEREKWVLKLYQEEERAEALEQLCQLGVDHLYSGAKATFNGKDFDLLWLEQQPGTALIYNENDIQILRICAP